MNSKKLIKFKDAEYRKAHAQGSLKLSAWNDVVEQVSLLTDVPEDRNEYEEMLLDPSRYATRKICAEHRPDFPSAISTNKLLDLLEKDRAPLERAFALYQRYPGSLIVDDTGKVSYFVDEEQFKVYAETDAELERLNTSLKLIEAFKHLKTLDYPDFNGSYGGNGVMAMTALKEATGNLLNWENGELVPSDYWIKKA